MTIMGCGSSPGTPRPNGDWGACDPTNPRNRRSRAALLVERLGAVGTTRIVVDVGPDFRMQCIDNGIDRLDAVVLTHPHADHIHGIDDLRTYALQDRKRIPVWADDETYGRLLETFSYCFLKPAGSAYPPICERLPIDHGNRFSVEGPGGSVTFEPLPQQHGAILSLGFRIGDFAYCSDVSAFPPATLEKLEGLDCLVIDALQYREHPSHLSVRQARSIIERLAPRRAVLTHMHTPLDYDALRAELPEGIEPGYDGLVIDA